MLPRKHPHAHAVPSAEPSGNQESLRPQGSAKYSQDLSVFIDLFPGLRSEVTKPITLRVRFKQGEALSAADDAERALTVLQAAPRDEQLDFITLALGMTRS